MSTGDCSTGNEYDGRMSLRVSSVFVILIGSALGAIFPVYAARHKGVGIPGWAFFVAKYFGSGVIVATAFIHLLAPAHEALTDGCLTGPITEYAWADGICLMAVFLLFFVELLTMRFAKFGHSHGQEHEHGPPRESGMQSNGSKSHSRDGDKYRDDPSAVELSDTSRSASGGQGVSTNGDDRCLASPYAPGDNHLSHSREHPASLDQVDRPGTFDPESYAAQMTAIFILEFGVIFHSVFIGLTLAVAGAEFVTLYIVLTFHQTFEGLALGSRLGSIEWPESKRLTPYFMAIGYALSTPIAIAVGLGVRTSFNPGSQATLITNGVFDAISAGILIYTGLVELMAHEFMFSSHMQRAPIRVVLGAVGWMALGAALMAILGKWA